jgi:DNA-binding transcriptional LysR family regulator
MPWDQRVAQRLKLRDLYVLQTVVQLGSMGKAAGRLAVSQPAISKAITDLEHVLGARLLDRSRQGVEATQYGAALLKWSDVVFDNLRQSVDEIDFLADPTGGEVRIGSTDLMLSTLVPALIARLSQQFPKMVFKVSVAPGIREQFHDLRARKVDLVLGRILGPKPEDDLDVEILFQDPLFIVAGKNSKWHRRRKIRVAELLNEPWVLPSYDTFVGSIAREAFQSKGLEPPRITVSSSSIPSYTGLLATGRFLALRSASWLHLHGRDLSERALPVDVRFRSLNAGIVTLKNRPVSPAAKLFIECARKLTRPLANARELDRRKGHNKRQVQLLPCSGR